MYAVIRELTYDPQKLNQGQAQADEFRRLRAQQPGAQGNLTVDVGGNRLIVIDLWDSEAQQQAAAQVLQPQAQRLIRPLLTGDARVLGSGEVIHDDRRGR